MAEDDPQYMMNRAKRDIIMATLAAKGGKCKNLDRLRYSQAGSFFDLFEEADRQHCDVLTAALLSLKRAKVVTYDGMMLLMPTHKDVQVTLIKPEYDPFA